MRLIAHRGLVTKNIKENTIEAFKAAIDSPKYSGFELDIRVSIDNEFVVYHDLMFKGKLIKNITYKELKKENVPKLTDVLKLNTNKIIMIEIKDYDIDLKKLANLLKKYNKGNIYVSSFNNKVLKKLKGYIKSIKIGPLNYIINSEEDYSIYDFICIINYILTDELISYFKNKNIEVFAYGIKHKKRLNFNNIYYIVDDLITR